jgi:DNA (cytosine-5)-methyltransferase 1
LDDLGYALEWRVINAAEYGMPQRRRRIFLVGYYKNTAAYKSLKKSNKLDWITKEGTIAKAFPVMETTKIDEVVLEGDLTEITENFNIGGKLSPFQNAGTLIGGKVYTSKTLPKYKGKRTVLGDVLQEEEVPEEFYISENDFKKWEYLKGAKKETRVTADGFEYNYSEGGMIFPDALDNASRTIITGEGGKSASRFKHVINTDKGPRRLTPLELERRNMFPDNPTK